MDHQLLFFYSFCFVLFVSFCIFPFYLFSYFFLSSTLHVLLFNFPLLTIPEAGWGHSETSRGKWLRSKKVLPPHLWYVLTESLFWHSKSNPRSNVPRKETQQHCQPRGLALIPPHPLPHTIINFIHFWIKRNVGFIYMGGDYNKKVWSTKYGSALYWDCYHSKELLFIHFLKVEIFCIYSG